MSFLTYIGRSALAAKRPAVALGLTLALAGCSMSMFGGGDAPKTTGSIAPVVEVQGPIPKTLAYSDATMIGEAARMAMLQAEGADRRADRGDWVNSATGSSGTIESFDLPNPPAAGACRPFSTTVTSIGGVHEYSGALCPDLSGRPRLKIDERV